MTSKFDEIKLAVEAVKNVPDWYFNASWDDEGIVTAIANAGEFRLGDTGNYEAENILDILGNSRDYLKALLPVVEAAAVLRDTIVEKGVIMRPPEFEDIEKLIEALKALDSE